MFKQQLSRDTWSIWLYVGAIIVAIIGLIFAFKAGIVWIVIGTVVGPIIMATVLLVVCEALRWPQSRKEQVQSVVARAREVVTHLAPRASRNTPVEVYEDEFLIIRYPNHKGEVSVNLKLNGEETPVFIRNLKTCELFYYRRGKWEKYLNNLAKTADGVRRRKLIDEKAKLIDEEAKRMGVIDDANVFSR